MRHDHLLGFPPATDEAFMADYEFEHYGIHSGDPGSPYPFGVPKRVREEDRKAQDVVETLYRKLLKPKRRVVVEQCMAGDFKGVYAFLAKHPSATVDDPHEVLKNVAPQQPAEYKLTCASYPFATIGPIPVARGSTLHRLMEEAMAQKADTLGELFAKQQNAIETLSLQSNVNCFNAVLVGEDGAMPF